MIFKHLLRKEWIQIRRNSFVARLVVLFPVLIMCVAPWITSMEVRDVAVVVVDHDRSMPSRRLVEEVRASRYFKFMGLSSSYAEAFAYVEKCKADVVLEIPRRFGRYMELGKQPRVLIAANAVNGTKGALGSAYLSGLVAEVMPASRSLLTVSNGTIVPVRLYNRHESYKVNMIPALMAMVMILLCGFLPALNVVSEKETGTIEQINVTPVSKWQFILAKLIPYWCIGLADYAICLLLSWGVYGITSTGHVALLFAAAMLLALIFSSIGLIVSNYSDSLQQAMFVMWFVLVCMMLLSGLFTPVSSMPAWAQMITQGDPVRHYIDVARSVFVRGSGFEGVKWQFMLLAGMAVGLSSWAVVSYRKRG